MNKQKMAKPTAQPPQLSKQKAVVNLVHSGAARPPEGSEHLGAVSLGIQSKNQGWEGLGFERFDAKGVGVTG